MKHIIIAVFAFFEIFTALLKSQDISWKRISIPDSSKSQTILVSQENLITLGTSDNLYYSENDGNTWIQRTSQLPVHSIICLASNAKGYIFAGVSFEGLYYTTDGWKSYQRYSFLNSSLLSTGAECFYSRNMNMYAGAMEGILWQSKDYGITWLSIAKLPGYKVSSIAVNDSCIFAGTGNQGIFKSTDNGKQWSTSGFPDSYIDYLASDKSNNIYAVTKQSLYKSSDNGVSWNAIIIDSAASKVNRILISKEDEIIAGTDKGIYLSHDQGNSWIKISSNLPASSYNNFTISPEGHIYVENSNDAIYKSSSIITNINKPEPREKYSYFLNQNYPNPFNPVTTISYSIPQELQVELRVYDMLGREVSTLVKSEQTVGEYKVQFDGSYLPSGMYIYSIQAGEYRASKKLIILK